MQGRINAILALGCNGTSVDRLGDMRRDPVTLLRHD